MSTERKTDRQQARRGRGEAARPVSEEQRRQRVTAERRKRADNYVFTLRFCWLCVNPTKLYLTRRGLNNHAVEKHLHYFLTLGDAYIPIISDADLERARARRRAGRGRRRRTDPADKEPAASYGDLKAAASPPATGRRRSGCLQTRPELRSGTSTSSI